MKTPDCVDAQQMHKDHPDTFFAPKRFDLDRICKEGHVQVCVGRERFWVTVKKVVGEMVEGVINNELVLSEEHHLRFGDDVRFQKKNVYKIK